LDRNFNMPIGINPNPVEVRDLAGLGHYRDAIAR